LTIKGILDCTFGGGSGKYPTEPEIVEKSKEFFLSSCFKGFPQVYNVSNPNPQFWPEIGGNFTLDCP
jgi:hypothetical protein